MKGLEDVSAAFAESRHAWRDFVELFAIEGRIASLRLVRLIILALLGGLLILIAWFLLCLAGAETLRQRYEWEWNYILLALASFHLVAALLVVLALCDTGKRFFFPAILAQLRGNKDHHDVPHFGNTKLEQDRQLVEASLERAKLATTQAVRRSEQEFKVWLTKPTVLASAVAVGFFLAPRRLRNHAPHTSPSLIGLVLPMILNQVMAAAIARVVASHDAKSKFKHATRVM